MSSAITQGAVRLQTRPTPVGGVDKIGHVMKDCTKADNNCLACEIAGLPKISHKQDSGACAAR